MGMVVRMVHNLVAGIGQSFDRLRIFVHPLAYYEKSNFYIVFSKNVNQLLGVFIAPG